MNLSDLRGNTFNKDKVAIVVVGYNRIKSISRLLNSLLVAKYPNDDVPLVISIDCSGDLELYSYVQEFEWPFGDKYVNIQSERLGLKNHILQCGDLCTYFNAIILLEDDLYVSPYFYQYTLKTLEKYGGESKIAQISLYKNEMNGYVGLPFDNMKNGYDVFLMQDVSTWGQCWNMRMWGEFKKWMDTITEDDIQRVDMPIQIKKWTNAWSKYYNAFVVDQHKYVVYPNVSLTTNFSDAGVHGGHNNSIVQVNLLQNDFEYRLGDINDLVAYDIFFNNESIYRWLGLTDKDLCLDLSAFYRDHSTKRYLLSTALLPYKVIRSFALNLRPIELNVKYNISGEGIYLYDTTFPTGRKISKLNHILILYHLRCFNTRYLLKYILKYYIKTLYKKIVR